MCLNKHTGVWCEPLDMLTLVNLFAWHGNSVMICKYVASKGVTWGGRWWKRGHLKTMHMSHDAPQKLEPGKDDGRSKQYHTPPSDPRLVRQKIIHRETRRSKLVLGKSRKPRFEWVMSYGLKVGNVLIWEKSNLSTSSSLLDKSLVLGMRLSIHTRSWPAQFFIVVFDRETGEPKGSGTVISVVNLFCLCDTASILHFNVYSLCSPKSQWNGCQRSILRDRPCGFRSVSRGKDHRKRWASGWGHSRLVLRTPSEHRSRGGPRNPSNDPESFLASLPECIQLWRAADEGFGYPSFMKSPSESRLWLVFFSP